MSRKRGTCQLDGFLEQVQRSVANIKKVLDENFPDKVNDPDYMLAKEAAIRFMFSNIFIEEDNIIVEAGYNKRSGFWKKLNQAIGLKEGQDINLSDFFEKEVPLRIDKTQVEFEQTPYYSHYEDMMKFIWESGEFKQLQEVLKDGGDGKGTNNPLYWTEIWFNSKMRMKGTPKFEEARKWVMTGDNFKRIIQRVHPDA